MSLRKLSGEVYHIIGFWFNWNRVNGKTTKNLFRSISKIDLQGAISSFEKSKNVGNLK